MNAAARAATPSPFRAAVRTHAGCRRPLNEDRVLNRTADGFWAVADGMGGHQGGEQAAERLARALDALPQHGGGYARLARIERAAAEVNAALWAEAGGVKGGAGGATLVALLVHESHAACLWAGDSRAYRLRDGRLSLLTRDHSLVQELVDTGALAEGERAGHPMRHVITRAVGAAAELELDRDFDPLRPGDLFLLCSDGLTGCVDEARIADRLRTLDIEAAADGLLDDALAAGAPDNVSLVIAAPG